MKKRIKTIIIITLCSMNILLGQSSAEKRAAMLYEKLAYEEASEAYSSLANRDDASDETIRRAAYTNYYLGKTDKAAVFYKKLVDLKKAQPEDVYNYAKCLKASNKLEESESVFKYYAVLTHNEELILSPAEKEKRIANIKEKKPYFELLKIEGNSSQSDFGPYYLNDSTILFASNRKGSLTYKRNYVFGGEKFLDLFQAKPDSLGNLTEIKKYVKSLNTRFNEGTICLNKAGDLMFFTRNNYTNSIATESERGVNYLQLFKAKKVGEKWTEELLPFNNKSYSCGHPTLSLDESTLYFVSDMPNGIGGTDIYKIKINSDGSINGNPENLGKKINTIGDEMFPVVCANKMFFSSDGHIGLGQLDVFSVSIDKKGQFGDVSNMGTPINSEADDFGLVLKNNNSGYLSSNRAGGMGSDDIYFVKKLHPKFGVYSIKGVVKNKVTSAPLGGATITLSGKNGNKLDEIVSDSSGNYKFKVEFDQEYVLKGAKPQYFTSVNKLKTNELSYENPDLLKDLNLVFNEGFTLYGVVTDRQDNKPLQDVNVKIIDLATGKTLLNENTPSSGNFKKVLIGATLNDKVNYTVTLEKDGYLRKTISYKRELDKSGVFDLNEEMDLGLDRAEVGMDITKIIKLNPIYFDFAKWDIRKDAALELDRVVKVMKDNPKIKIELGSHTDCRKSAESNMNLSNARAQASADYIISKGIKRNRIISKGYGESNLINDCPCDEVDIENRCTEEQHQLNRRTEFLILKM